MSSQAQIDANRKNAQLSTGPTSPEGKAASSANSRRHGLLAASGHYFTDEEQEDYNALEAKLVKECIPASEIEYQTFRRYTFNLYQTIRSQRLEVEMQDKYLDNPTEENFQLMERFVKITALLERRADKALTELRKLQRDRVSSLDVHNELYLLEKKIPIPATLPIADMRRTNQSKTSPFEIALMILNTTGQVRDMVENQTKPADLPDLHSPVATFDDQTLTRHAQQKIEANLPQIQPSGL